MFASPRIRRSTHQSEAKAVLARQYSPHTRLNDGHNRFFSCSLLLASQRLRLKLTARSLRDDFGRVLVRWQLQPEAHQVAHECSHCCKCAMWRLVLEDMVYPVVLRRRWRLHGVVTITVGE